MSIEDVIRVADLKTRAARTTRIAHAIKPRAGQVMTVTEFVAPRVEEICATLPYRLGKRMLASERARRVLIGEYEIGLQRFRNQAVNYALDELYGLGFRASDDYAEKIQAVTIQDVKRVAEKYIRPSAHTKAVVKPCGPRARPESADGGKEATLAAE